MTTVNITLDHPKLDGVVIEAKLTVDELNTYTKLKDDNQRLDYLMGKESTTRISKEQYNELLDKQGTDTSDTVTESLSTKHKEDKQSLLKGDKGEQPKVKRQVRLNINGQDTGWVEVTDENESEYQELFNDMKERQLQIETEFNNIVKRMFNPFELWGTHPFGLSHSTVNNKHLDDGTTKSDTEDTPKDKESNNE